MSASAELRVLARYLSCIIEAWLSRHTLLGSDLFDLALAPPIVGEKSWP